MATYINRVDLNLTRTNRPGLGLADQQMAIQALNQNVLQSTQPESTARARLRLTVPAGGHRRG